MLICPSFPVVDLYLVSSFFLNIFRYWEKKIKNKPTMYMGSMSVLVGVNSNSWGLAGWVLVHMHMHVNCNGMSKNVGAFPPFFIFFLENYKKDIDYLHQRCK